MMMRRMLAGLVSVLLIAACDSEQVAKVPEPLEPTQNSTGYYCNMTVVEHDGPKGHVFLVGDDIPFWFTSVRDTIAFTMLPEESKDIAIVYVNDMAKANSWAKPEAGNWINAKEAVYVIGSTRVGGMGAPEPVPFSLADKAAEFTNEFGGEIVAFADIPRELILSDPNEMASDVPEASEIDASGHNHHNTHGQNQ